MHLIAVLGYSSRGDRRLHELCSERLRHAEQLVGDADVVLLSGWGRRRGGTSEAELMRRAWHGSDTRTIQDATARSTVGNAVSVASTARRVGATEVTVVTSRWHAFRARTLVRAALPRTSVRSSSPVGSRPPSLVARELLCLLVLPYQLMRVRLRGDRS